MKTYTKKEMAHLLDVSTRTILTDIQFLNLKATLIDRGTKLYSEKDFNLIGQLREYCKDKTHSRESFVPNTEVEILDLEPVVSKLSRLKKDFLPVKIAQETILNGLESDPLFDLELLQRISDRGWLLPTSRLAPILNLSHGYLKSFQKYSYCGFTISKEKYVGNKIMWKVRQE